VASRIAAAADGAASGRAGTAVPAVPARIFSCGFVFVLPVAIATGAAAGRSAADVDGRAIARVDGREERAGPPVLIARAPPRTRRRDNDRKETGRKDARKNDDIVPPLPGAPRPNPLAVKISVFSSDFQ